MPSWVVPAVAAELWGVTVEHVLAEAAAGRINSRSEGEFLFVDVSPSTSEESPEAVKPVTTYRRSLAWTQLTTQPIVTPEEREALLDEGKSTIAEDEDIPYGDAPAPAPLTSDDIPNWEAVRARVGRSRRPPMAREAA